MITNPVVKRLVELLHTIGTDWDMPVEEVGSDRDHLHLFCKSYPDIPPSRVVKLFKGISARELLREFPHLRCKTGAGLWGVGYYLSTVGHGTYEGAVRAYVRNQGKPDQSFYTQLKLKI